MFSIFHVKNEASKKNDLIGSAGVVADYLNIYKR